MNNYIFITSEGYTYQPNSISVEPDIDNMQVIGSGEGNTAQEAFLHLIKQNTWLAGTDFNEIFAIQLANSHREYFYQTIFNNLSLFHSPLNSLQHPLYHGYK